MNQGLCGYVVAFETIQERPYITIDQGAGAVSVRSSDRTLEMEHSIQIKATIQVPQDHTLSTFDEVESLFSFKLDIVDPCRYTVLDEPVLTAMVTSVKGIADEQIFDPV